MFSMTPSTVLAEENDTATSDYILIKEGYKGDYAIQVQMRLKDLGYFNYKITNVYGSYTKETLRMFQEENGLPADGILGPETAEVLFSNAAKRKPVEEIVKPEPKSAAASSVPTGALKDWFSYVYPRFSRGEKIKVWDVETGITYYMVRVGGSNHADVEPASASDTKKFLETYGGEWSWDRRAVVVRLDGEYIAASTNGFPHGYETVSGNGMEGQVCIHFLNSKTHIRDAVDSAHQAMVYKAAGK
jgi:peptidoglycan hydrolase-like protein with peptidoglycan-binding domain